jgi:hypothetical protein
MTAAVRHRVAAHPSPLAILQLRAWAAGYLCWVGERDFHDAVDDLQATAERDGLLKAYGPDRVQEIIAAAFAEGMPRQC